jgi:hypothetical protein
VGYDQGGSFALGPWQVRRAGYGASFSRCSVLTNPLKLGRSGRSQTRRFAGSGHHRIPVMTAHLTGGESQGADGIAEKGDRHV